MFNSISELLQEYLDGLSLSSFTVSATYAVLLGVFIALILCLPSPIVAVLLLKSNRARGRARENFLADRFVQICHKGECASSNSKTTVWHGIFTSNETNPPVAKESDLDIKLKKFYLVDRYEKEGLWMVRRKRGYWRLYSWSTFIICKFLLKKLFGDEEMPD